MLLALPPHPHLAAVRAHHDIALEDALVRIPVHRLRQGRYEELPLDLEAHRIAVPVSASGWTGREMIFTPRGLTASATALAMAAGAPMVPPSPMPLWPPGVRGEGVSRWPMVRNGSVSATGRAYSIKVPVRSCPLSS